MSSDLFEMVKADLKLQKKRESCRKWRTKHPNASKNWYKMHSEVKHPSKQKDYVSTYWKEYYQKRKATLLEGKQEYYLTHTQEVAVRRKACRKVPLKELCELCPDEDKRNAVLRHHPDYAFPFITVSVCQSCHAFVHSKESINAC